MIRIAHQDNIPVIILPPLPNMTVDLEAEDYVFQQHTEQVKSLIYPTWCYGQLDSITVLRQAGVKGDLMAQGNHTNAEGHRLIADLLFSFIEK